MTSYTTYHVELTKAQLQRVQQGLTIRLSHARLTGSDVLLLTRTQIAKIERAKASGKGCEIQLSSAQLRHNIKHGSGKFSQFFAAVGNKVRDKALDVAGAAGGLAINAGSKLLGATVKGFTNELPDIAKRGVDYFVDMGLNAGANWSTQQLQGFLRGLKSTKTGSGVLGKQMRPVAIDLQGLLLKGKTGGALVLPGASRRQ